MHGEFKVIAIPSPVARSQMDQAKHLKSAMNLTQKV
jgi:hypothetical protein